jgi:hypothetical protein
LTDREANALRELAEHKLAAEEGPEKKLARPKKKISRAGWARSKKAKVV